MGRNETDSIQMDPTDSACARDSGSDHPLTGDNPVDGTLTLLAQNATLAKVTSANGSVAEADVKGDVFLLMGDPSVTMPVP